MGLHPKLLLSSFLIFDPCFGGATTLSSLSQLDVSRGLRVQFEIRREWAGRIIGKAGARISRIENSTGCNIRVVNGGVAPYNSGRAWSSGGGGYKYGEASDRGYLRGSGGRGGGWNGVSNAEVDPGLCRVVISGPDADSVREAREQTELVEARVSVGAEEVSDELDAEHLGSFFGTFSREADVGRNEGLCVWGAHFMHSRSRMTMGPLILQCRDGARRVFNDQAGVVWAKRKAP